MLTQSRKLLNAVKKLYTKVTGGKTTKSNDLPTVIDSMAENYVGGGSGGGNIYKYGVVYIDSANNAINKVTILSSTDYDFGEFPFISSLFPNLTQAQMKLLFEFTDVVSNKLFDTLDTSVYHDNTHSISSELHGYIITNESTSQNVVYIDIAYDETTDTYSFDTSYSQVIGGVTLQKMKI